MNPGWGCATERSKRNSGQKVTPFGTISEKISHTAGRGRWRREVRRGEGRSEGPFILSLTAMFLITALDAKFRLEPCLYRF